MNRYSQMAEQWSCFEEDQIRTPAACYRGGTSKAFFVERDVVAELNEEEIERWICAMYGSPDKRQIDGVGGADPLTSKFALIGKPTRDDADIDYSFYQVVIEQARVAKIPCGNISSAAAMYAIDAGYVKPRNGETEVGIHNTNDGKLYRAVLQTPNGKLARSGDYVCEGVPGTSAPIRIDFSSAAGSETGKLFPTGSLRDTLSVDGLGNVEVSIVDCACLIAFIPASVLGIAGNEDPMVLLADKDLVTRLEALRAAVFVRLGMRKTTQDYYDDPFPGLRISICSEPQAWVPYGAKEMRPADTGDITVRGNNVNTFTKAYWGTGSVCTGVACSIPGTIPNEYARDSSVADGKIRLCHASGAVDLEVALTGNGPESYVVNKAMLLRTARRLMEGIVEVPAEKVFLR